MIFWTLLDLLNSEQTVSQEPEKICKYAQINRPPVSGSTNMQEKILNMVYFELDIMFTSPPNWLKIPLNAILWDKDTQHRIKA
jgi:hypothetical protein